MLQKHATFPHVSLIILYYFVQCNYCVSTKQADSGVVTFIQKTSLHGDLTPPHCTPNTMHMSRICR